MRLLDPERIEARWTVRVEFRDHVLESAYENIAELVVLPAQFFDSLLKSADRVPSVLGLHRFGPRLPTMVWWKRRGVGKTSDSHP
jgi:hypothetical protein